MGLLAPWALLGPVVPAQPPLGPPLLCLGIHSSPVLPLSKSSRGSNFGLLSWTIDHILHLLTGLFSLTLSLLLMIELLCYALFRVVAISIYAIISADFLQSLVQFQVFIRALHFNHCGCRGPAQVRDRRNNSSLLILLGNRKKEPTRWVHPYCKIGRQHVKSQNNDFWVP